MKLSIIVPTIGRESLYKLLAQLTPQLQGQDEIIVVEDGADNARSVGSGTVRYVRTRKVESGGSYQRNVGIQIALGSHLAFLDDDDAVDPYYIAHIKANADHENMTLFKMRGPDIWTDQNIREANVSTQMVIVPNEPWRLPKWREDVYQSDYHFIEACSKMYAVKWVPHIIATRNGSR